MAKYLILQKANTVLLTNKFSQLRGCINSGKETYGICIQNELHNFPESLESIPTAEPGSARCSSERRQETWQHP